MAYLADPLAQPSNCSCYFQDGYVLDKRAVCPNYAFNVTILYSIIESIIQSQCKIADPCRQVVASSDFDAEYDFVIVGGGVAGSIVARRLLDATDYKVLVLEAGQEQPTVIEVPTFQLNASNTPYDWQYKTTPQEGAFVAAGGIANWPRGKMLCGSNCIGAFAYSRGSPEVYNDWGKRNPGWTFNELLPFFKKSERNKEPPNEIIRSYHGFNGPLIISRYSYGPAARTTVTNAFHELGFRRVDSNAGGNLTDTVFDSSVSIENGVLVSVERAFLRPVIRRPNLRVLIQALATKILFNASGTRATGVEFEDRTGQRHRVRASKEVIVCGGVVGSPQLLLLSGVGRRAQLQPFGIKQVRDLPVGENLNRHVAVIVNVSYADANNNTLDAATLQEYSEKGTGPFASFGMNEIAVFFTTKYAAYSNVPDIQFYFAGYSSLCQNCHPGCGHGYVIFQSTYTTSTCRGTIRLRSADPHDKPLIDPNYLCNERELQTLYEGVKLVRRVTQTKVFRPKLLQFDSAGNENCAFLKRQNDPTNQAYWYCVIRQYTRGENHHGGTCKMGPANDRTAVVDNELRVHGVKNLRVTDCSIFPTQPNTNNLAATMVVAEKGADLIIKTYTRANG